MSASAPARYVEATVNDEFDIVVGTLDNEEGVPMVSAYYIKGMIHALYPEFCGASTGSS